MIPIFDQVKWVMCPKQFNKWSKYELSYCVTFVIKLPIDCHPSLELLIFDHILLKKYMHPYNKCQN